MFFDYDGIGNPPFVLPKGKYSLIYPDSVFCIAYPEIAYDLSMTWANERKIQTLTYIKNDSGTVFVKSNGDNNMRFQILFDEIRISPNDAKVRFKTSCECRGNEIGTMHFFDADLVLNGKDWEIKTLVTRDVYGCKASYPGKTIKIK